ncbi:hypothetical protein M422DRAFT_248566 [Sphaerobolus stellatus SS14]|nr:hypothetical protein M422DRAFT_248566 [Sphaerobolus stellatus SS14]
MHGALKKVNDHIKSLKAEAEDRNTLAGEELYHKYNLQQLESLCWAHGAFLEVARLDIGLRELKLKLKVIGQPVLEDLLDDAEQGHTRIISKHNYIVRTCASNMKQLATRKANTVKGHLQISAQNLSIQNYPSHQPLSGSISVRDSPSAYSSTLVAREQKVWLEAVSAWWGVYAHIVITHE